MPESSDLATSVLLDGTITLAPASFNPREVSRPIPEYPPVTIATFPFKSIPLSISFGSLLAPKPESIGRCCSEIIFPPFSLLYSKKGQLTY